MKWIAPIFALVFMAAGLILIDEILLNKQLRAMHSQRSKRQLSKPIINDEQRKKGNSIVHQLTSNNLVNTSMGTENTLFQINPGKSHNKTQNIVFLKTHKTGSSTITSILNRYADLYDLTMCLPVKQYNRFRYPNKFNATYINENLYHSGNKSNILANHARMNKREIEKVMQPNSKYITILRNPVTLFESAFYYFEIHKEIGLTNHSDPLSVFLNDTVKYYRILQQKENIDAFGLVQNGMLYDLGFEHKQLTTTENIDNAIQKVEEEFDLVLITEYFDESLVLLMRKFHWTFDDILYLKQNERAKKRKKLSENYIELIKQWNDGDNELYQIFNKTFWRKIKEEGISFWKDLKEFKARKEAVTKHCDFIKYVEKSQKTGVDIHVFKLSYTYPILIPFCKKLLTDEVDYVKYFRNKYQTKYTE